MYVRIKRNVYATCIMEKYVYKQLLGVVVIMEYILQNTDLFDEEIGIKFNKVITTSNQDNITNGKIYKLTVSFHVNLLNDMRFEEFNIPVPSKTSKGTKQDKIYDVMSFQLKCLENILNDHGIEVYSKTIQGDYLETEKMIKIVICEDTSEPKLMGRGKNKRRMKVSSIVPSMPYTQENVSKLAAERICKIYFELMNVINSRKIMSEIVEIEETEDDGLLIQAFAKRYGDLWLTTNEREKELLERLKERTIFVLNKYIEKEGIV